MNEWPDNVVGEGWGIWLFLSNAPPPPQVGKYMFVKCGGKFPPQPPGPRGFLSLRREYQFKRQTKKRWEKTSGYRDANLTIMLP